MNHENSIHGVNGTGRPVLPQQQNPALPWSFTGPPPGQFMPPPAFPSGHGPIMHGPPVPQPYMMGQMGMSHPHQVPFSHGPPPPQFLAYSRPPYPDPGRGHSSYGTQQNPGRTYANKKERDRAKKDRKEARKLAENPLEPITEDAQPRPFLNDTERQETLQWIADRKASFPTRALVQRKAAASAALSEAGGSEGRSACDERLFAVLQEQHSRGLLRSAGTEDLFRSFLARGRGRGGRGGRGRGRRQGRGQGRGLPPSAGCLTSCDSTVLDGAKTANTQPAIDQKSSAAEPDPKDGISQLESTPVPTHDVHTEILAEEEPCRDQSDGVAGGSNPAATQINEGAPDDTHPPTGTDDREDLLGKRKPGRAGGKSAGSACKSQKRQPGWQRQGPIPGPQHKPCLLHRLIAPDVRQDRSLLLQVFRFFVANNFLQNSDKELMFPRQGHSTLEVDRRSSEQQ